MVSSPSPLGGEGQGEGGNPPQDLRYIVKPKRRRRWRLITLTIIIAVICLWWFWPRHDRILDLAAELDQRDPGWRWDEMQAKQPKVPGGENAAQTLIKIAHAIPASFAPDRPPLVRKTKPGFGLRWLTIGDDLATTAPAEQLNEDLAKELITELQATAGVRQLLPELFRYSSAQQEMFAFADYMKRMAGPPLVPVKLMKLPDLLSIELESALQNGNPQLIRDRSLLFIHGLKLYCDMYPMDAAKHFDHITNAAVRLERALVQSEENAEFLEKLQNEVRDIHPQNGYIRALRYIRARDFALYDAIRNHFDELIRDKVINSNTRFWFMFVKNDVIEGQTLMVEYYTYRLDQVQGDAQAEGKLKELLQRIEKSRQGIDNILFEYWDRLFGQGLARAYHVITTATHKTDPAFRQALAAKRVMVAAIAAERFRLKNGRWPNDLHELVPTFLVEVPKDPCSPGNELRWKVTATGRIVYSVGLDGKDDGGNCDWMGENQMTDIGFRLFDQRVQQKGKPSAQ
jgi:hypothetical protein